MRNGEQKLVSVIMAAYNAEKTVKTAIQSILQQTYENFELIICDDASTDETWKILTRLSENDPRIKLIHQAVNRGAAAARNRCLEQARGEYVAIMDADDVSYPLRLELQLNYLCENPSVSFVGSRGEFFSVKPGDLKQYYWFVEKPTKADFLMTLPFVHASLVFRKEALTQLGGYRDSRLVQRSEDYDLLLRAYAAGLCGSNLPMVLYGIRLDQSTYSRRKYRYRFNECAVKFFGFKNLGLMPRGILFAVKPLIVGLLPTGVLNKLKEKYYGKQENDL